jgi:carbamate kinase
LVASRPDPLGSAVPAVPPERPLVLVAMGGHAFIQKGERGTVEDHTRNGDRIADLLMSLVERDYRIVITHGNGPQVGSLLHQQEKSREEVPPMPLDVLVAMTEGSLGYLLQQSLLNQLHRRGMDRRVVTVVTQVLVDGDDPAFQEPDKPVGPFLSEAEARARRETLGWEVREERDRGWRRVVPSPRPRRILQHRMIREAAREGHLVVAGGGGGIPVRKDGDGRFVGVEGVVDKDLTSSVLASDIGATLLIILTAVPNVYVDFGTPRARPLGAVTLDEIEGYFDEGQFPRGSMGPKVEAVIQFLRSGGRRALVTDPESLPRAIEGRAGTHLVGRV